MLGLLPLAALSAIFLCLSLGSKAGATPVDLTAMTQNLYVGADADAISAPDADKRPWERGPASIVEARCGSPVPPRERPTPLRGTEGSNPFPSSGESGANLTSSIMLGYARSDSGPCRLGPTHAVIALVSAPGSTLADSHVAGPRGRSEEWYYKRGFWPRPSQRKRCRRDLCWNLIGTVSGWMRIRGQAARSIGLSASFWVRLCHPSTLRMVTEGYRPPQPRISPFSPNLDDRHSIPHITARLRRR
jgi:hypothetical protein